MPGQQTTRYIYDSIRQQLVKRTLTFFKRSLEKRILQTNLNYQQARLLAKVWLLSLFI